MKIYFVRHGESEGNAGHLVQNKKTPLSEKGRKQAEALAERLANTPIDVIYASMYERARETADIINKVLKKEIIYTEFLGEKKQPTEIEGKIWNDPTTASFLKARDEHQDDAAWHYSDEDNFFDFTGRVMKFFDVLEKETRENVLVVTHGGPIATLLYRMAFGKPELTEPFYRFMDFLFMSNTGVTLCERRDNGQYKLISWNDRSHFAE